MYVGKKKRMAELAGEIGHDGLGKKRKRGGGVRMLRLVNQQEAG